MQRRDRRLHLIRPDRTRAQRRLDQRLALGDLVAVPTGAVLRFEQHEITLGRDPRVASRVVQQHQGEQSRGLGVVGEPGAHETRQADRLAAQIVAHEVVARGRGVSLVEDQVQARQHPGEALFEQLGRWNPERDPRVADPALGPHDALGDRRLAHHERPRQLRRVETTHGLQGERDPSLDRERRVAAREQQAQTVVVDGRGRGTGGDRAAVAAVGVTLQAPHLAREGGVAPQPVERLATRGRRDPRRRFRRYARCRPGLDGDRQRVLGGIFREREIAEPPGEPGDDPAPLDPHDRLDRRVHVGGGGVCGHGTILPPGGPASRPGPTWPCSPQPAGPRRPCERPPGSSRPRRWRRRGRRRRPRSSRRGAPWSPRRDRRS